MSKEIVVSGKSQRYRCRETTVSGRALCGWHRIKYISPSTYHYNIAHHTNRSANTVNATHTTGALIETAAHLLLVPVM